jgi:hypothetical protein
MKTKIIVLLIVVFCIVFVNAQNIDIAFRSKSTTFTQS